MKISPTTDDWALASAIYAEFRAKPESQHIASRYALAYLSALVCATRPERVLEIGAGIGTVTKLLLTHPAKIGSVVSTEAHEGCLHQLSRNLSSSDHWRLYHDVKEAAGAGPFDLVVIDGVIEPAHCALFNKESAFFVEGNRLKQRQMLERVLAQSNRTVEFRHYSPGWRVRQKFWLGVLPIFKFRRLKGCFVGRVKTGTGH